MDPARLKTEGVFVPLDAQTTEIWTWTEVHDP